MEIKKSDAVSFKEARVLREGDVVRVRVVRDIGKEVYLVDVRGKLLSARLSGGITSSFFIARVLKTAPLIELKFLRSLERVASPFNREKIAELLRNKKASIQKLPISDNFPAEKAKDGAGDIKEALKRSVANLDPSRVMNGAQPQSSEYYVLQSLFNLLSVDSFIFLFPFIFGRKRLLCDLQVFGGRDAAHYAVYLSLTFEDERRIGFLVFLDHELVKCTVTASDETIERRLRENVETLLKNLRSLGRNRTVTVNFVPYDEHLLFVSKMVKRVDVRM
jgi:hypothetical protein